MRVLVVDDHPLYRAGLKTLLLVLDPAARTGTSNRAEGPVELALDGPCLVILPRAHAAAAVRALAAS